MRKIKSLKRTERRFNGTSEYDLRFYEVEDELGNIELVRSLREYELGTRVELWHDDDYNIVKMRPYKEKRS